MKIKIADIVETISGEIGLFPQGAWCTIIRFGGCNLRCPYCDTKGTWTDENTIEMTPEEIVQRVHTKNVLITGGEPLVQFEGLDELVSLLVAEGLNIQIETNGSLAVSPRLAWWLKKQKVMLVVDYKGPSSKQNIDFDSFVNRFSNYCNWGSAIIKMVVASTLDLKTIPQFRKLFDEAPNAWVAFSPVDAKGYWAQYIFKVCEEEFAYELANGQIILSVQIHKNIMMP